MANQLIPLRPASNGGRAQSPLERLAVLAVPILLGALGMVLWSLLSGVLDGVRDNQIVIAEMQTSIGEIASALTSRPAIAGRRARTGNSNCCRRWSIPRRTNN